MTSPSFKFKKIMVIDDTYLDRYVVERVAKRYSFAEEVLSMESAAEGIEYLMSCADDPGKLPQLIFLDINMPGMNGFDFLERYNTLPDVIRRTCIVMMLTTSLHEEDRERAYANPYVQRFINKPLNEAQLKEIEKIV